MDTMQTFISGDRQFCFVSQFNYIREAGTANEKKAAETILAMLKNETSDVQIRTEEFSFFAPKLRTSFLR